MILIKTRTTLSNYLDRAREKHKSIGFVPTMGALHQGHLTLIRQAKANTDLVVCSIFVNPTQFNDPADYEKYPSTIEHDIQLLEEAGTTFLFLPSVAELYPEGLSDLETYNLGSLETELEGKFRPGHFQGVCQVMSRLLQSVYPNRLFMGQKDYQQCLVVERLINIIGLNTDLVVAPTVREASGLAMSSRNLRLSESEKENAKQLSTHLKIIAAAVHRIPFQTVKQEAVERLEKYNLRVEYIQLANAETLDILPEWNPGTGMVILAAVFAGEVRLIDNLLIGS